MQPLFGRKTSLFQIAGFKMKLTFHQFRNLFAQTKESKVSEAIAKIPQSRQWLQNQQDSPKLDRRREMRYWSVSSEELLTSSITGGGR